MQVMFRAAARGTRAPETARHASAGESVARKSLARAKASPGVAPVAGGGSRIVMHFAVVGRPQLYSGPRCDGGDKSHAGGDDGRLTACPLSSAKPLLGTVGFHGIRPE
jgi:hypothetical protein